MRDLVSVIIPVFNRAGTIVNALDSVEKQTYPKWEAVVVDDSSTDGTAQIVQDYARREPRVRLLSSDDRRGAQAARNIGIRAGRGRWISFLDSDDEWLPDSLERRLELATGNGLVVVHSDCFARHPGSDELERFGVPPMSGQTYKDLLERPGPMFQGMLVLREALEKVGGLDEEILAYQEWDTSLRLARYYEFGFIAEPTFIYDCRASDNISKDLIKSAQGYEQVFKKHRWAILARVGPRGLANHFRVVGRLYARTPRRFKAIYHLIMAILIWPFNLKSMLGNRQRSLWSRS